MRAGRSAPTLPAVPPPSARSSEPGTRRPASARPMPLTRIPSQPPRRRCDAEGRVSAAPAPFASTVSGASGAFAILGVKADAAASRSSRQLFDCRSYANRCRPDHGDGALRSRSRAVELGGPPTHVGPARGQFGALSYGLDSSTAGSCRDVGELCSRARGNGSYDQLVILQSSFRLAARQ